MIDLKREQAATLSRKKYNYTPMARLFFFGMDLVAGRKDSLSKAKLLEILASVPYREWEMKKYFQSTRKFRNSDKVAEASVMIEWSREAQDNEYMHLLVIHEKMKEESMKDAWYLSSFMVFFVVWTYVFIAKLMKYISLTSAYHFNAQFEDHAEHVYAQMVLNHPEWENQPLNNTLVKKYADVANWADVFRRIGLDERNHRNSSLHFCKRDEFIVTYPGMPEIND